MSRDITFTYDDPNGSYLYLSNNVIHAEGQVNLPVNEAANLVSALLRWITGPGRS